MLCTLRRKNVGGMNVQGGFLPEQAYPIQLYHTIKNYFKLKKKNDNQKSLPIIILKRECQYPDFFSCVFVHYLI
jgi:hypothetical protein